MSWFLLALKKYATFRGRSQRSEYWYFFLFYLLIVLALAFLDVLLGSSARPRESACSPVCSCWRCCFLRSPWV